MSRRRAVIVHDVGQARLALTAASAADTPVALLSAPGAAGYLGAVAFREMINKARADIPNADAQAVLDCGGEPGTALNAIRHGLDAVRIGAGPDLDTGVINKLADIAGQAGVDFETEGPPALDLQNVADPEAALSAWFADG